MDPTLSLAGPARPSNARLAVALCGAAAALAGLAVGRAAVAAAHLAGPAALPLTVHAPTVAAAVPHARAQAPVLSAARAPLPGQSTVGQSAAAGEAVAPVNVAVVLLGVLPAALAVLGLLQRLARREPCATAEEAQHFVALTVTGDREVQAPAKVHPIAGVSPPWMNRGPGRCPEPEQFLFSDPAKPDLTGQLPECPLTRAVKPADPIATLQRDAKAAVEAAGGFPLEVHATPELDALGVEYFAQNRERFQAALATHGCIWFRGFRLMQDIAGYRAFWEAVGMKPCLDPIHSSGLRKFASSRDGLYEEVNKPQLRGHYIGLHQESSSKRTAAAAAFVCFKRATVEGGRFFVADGAAILADMKPDTVQRLTEHGIRISVSNIDTPMAETEGLSGVGRGVLKGMVETFIAPKFDMELEMVWDADGKAGRLQAVEEVMPPVVRHPVTGVPIWFCNAHNHLRYLRDRRPCMVPEVGMTEVYLGRQLGRVSPEDCEEIRRACEKNIVAVPMEPGDVLLIDNYRALHGRDTFEGDRYHAVTWFTWDNPEWQAPVLEGQGTKDAFNKVINKYLDMLPKEF
eukprot:EG_transcript_5309